MLIRNYRKNIGLMAGVEFFAFLGITSFLDSLSQSKWNVSLADWTFGEYFSYDQSSL